nr:uncharacterized protein C19orf57 homolog [Zootoca vivipara]
MRRDLEGCAANHKVARAPAAARLLALRPPKLLRPRHLTQKLGASPSRHTHFRLLSATSPSTPDLLYGFVASTTPRDGARRALRQAFPFPVRRQRVRGGKSSSISCCSLGEENKEHGISKANKCLRRKLTEGNDPEMPVQNFHSDNSSTKVIVSGTIQECQINSLANVNTENLAADLDTSKASFERKEQDNMKAFVPLSQGGKLVPKFPKRRKTLAKEHEENFGGAITTGTEKTSFLDNPHSPSEDKSDQCAAGEPSGNKTPIPAINLIYPNSDRNEVTEGICDPYKQEDATDVVCGLIKELSNLNRLIMSTHRDLDSFKRLKFRRNRQSGKLVPHSVSNVTSTLCTVKKKREI